MRNVRLWRGLLGVDKRTVIEAVEFEEFEGQDAEGATASEDEGNEEAAAEAEADATNVGNS